MNSLFLVMVGGAVGSGARHLVGRAWLALAGPGFPFGTLTVNLVGGLAMGLLVGWLARHGAGENWRLLLGVGVLGGFTTFSSFSLEVVTMLQRGDTATALGYAIASVLGATLAVYAGLTVMRVAG